MKKANYLILCFCLLGFTLQAQWTTITNGPLWKDTDGNDIQAHGAGFLYYEGRWYMVGEDRSDQWHPDVNMYSSTDLVNWRFENKIIENGVTHPDLGTTRFIERPKLMRCPSTGQFVVWCHWEQGNYGASEAAVFYSNTINGDYTFHWAGRPMGIKSRDCNVFVDNDGTGYFISTTSENTDLGLFRLSNDYLSVVDHTVLFDQGYREAPAIVRLGNTYYMISSGLTGWDPNQAKLATSTSLTSGWSSLTNIGNSTAFDTQAASILTIQGSQKTTYLYVGDRWMDPGLPESKTIIFPISFSGNSMNFNYSREFDINFSTGETRATPGSSGYYRLRNRATGLYLDGMGRTSNGAAAAQYANTTSNNAQWELINSGSSLGTFYYLQNRGTGLKLDGMGRTSNGADAGQYANTTTHVNSQWIVEAYIQNYYSIRNRGTGLYLDGMGRTSNGSAAGQWANTTSNNAQWELVPVEGSAFTTSNNKLKVTEKNVAMKVFPNPVTDELHITNMEGREIKVFNALGELVLKRKIKSRDQIVKLGNYQSGIYHIRVAGNDGVAEGKVIKK